MLYLQTFSALALIMGLLGLLYWAAHRFRGRLGIGPNSSAIEVAEKVHLGEKRTLLLVRVAKRQFLLGATSSSISLLADLDSRSEQTEEQTAETEERRSVGSSFRSILEAVR